MKALIIKSNNGNHSGFDRKWSELSRHNSVKEARAMIKAYAQDDGEKIDKDGKGYTYDSLTTIVVLTKNDVEQGFFNGTYHGYEPKFITDYFKLKR